MRPRRTDPPTRFEVALHEVAHAFVAIAQDRLPLDDCPPELVRCWPPFRVMHVSIIPNEAKGLRGEVKYAFHPLDDALGALEDGQGLEVWLHGIIPGARACVERRMVTLAAGDAAISIHRKLKVVDPLRNKPVTLGAPSNDEFYDAGVRDVDQLLLYSFFLEGDPEAVEQASQSAAVINYAWMSCAIDRAFHRAAHTLCKDVALRAETILREHWPFVLSLAERLDDTNHIAGLDFHALVNEYFASQS